MQKRAAALPPPIHQVMGEPHMTTVKRVAIGIVIVIAIPSFACMGPDDSLGEASTEVSSRDNEEAAELEAQALSRSDAKDKPVIFVHGIITNGGGTDCANDWANAISVLRERGFTGPFITWGYYRENRNCYANYDGDVNTDLTTIARLFAQFVFKNYTSRGGRVVDVVAHSMGGLIVRRALTGVLRHEPGFPGWLYIEDVVTLSTPHSGAVVGQVCDNLFDLGQCAQMRPRSAFMTYLELYGQNPQSAVGTDWSLIGSYADFVVPGGVATGMNAGHKYIYTLNSGLNHTTIRTEISRGKPYGVDWQHATGTRSGYDPSAPGPLYITAQALYRWRDW